MKATNQSLKLNVAAVFYRDALDGDGGNATSSSCDVESFSRSVGTVRAHGGGDGCEDVASGLRDVMRLGWASPTRLMIHISDAPSHGERYHAGCNDNHTEGDHGIPKLLQQIKAMNVEYVFGRMNAHTDKMIEVFNQDVGGGWIKTAPATSAAELTTAATATMRKTIEKTFTRLTASSTEPKSTGARRSGAPTQLGGIGEEEEEERQFEVTSSAPNWAALPELPAEVWRNEALTDVASLADTSRGTLGWAKAAASVLFSYVPGLAMAGTRTKATMSNASVKVAAQPFAQGNALRAARQAQGGRRLGRLRAQGHKKKSATRARGYLQDVEENTIACALAKAFNAAHAPPKGSQLRYVEPSDHGAAGGGRGRQGDGRTLLLCRGEARRRVHQVLQQPGLLEPGDDRPVAAQVHPVDDEVTGGHMMVADLQGVKTADGYA